MQTSRVNLPTIALIAGTRVALGIGVGLLLAPRMSDERRRGAGWALLAMGALTTIPLVLEVMRDSEEVQRRKRSVRQTFEPAVG